MNLIADTWRQLVRRRLWPLAVLLLGGVVAVPFVLAKEPAPVAPPPAPVQEDLTAAEEAATGEPVVALASQADRSRRRRVLGSRKDPFAPAPPPKKPKKAKKANRSGDGAPEAPVTEPAPEPPSGGGAAPAPISPPVALPPVAEPPVAEEPEPKEKTYPADSLIVRFGDATADALQRTTLEKLQDLPAAAEEDTQTVLVYVGLTKDKKSAIFMIDAAAQATGDGSCKPHPNNCETVHLRKGETEFFDVEDEAGEIVAQYQLDLVDINVRKNKK